MTDHGNDDNDCNDDSGCNDDVTSDFQFCYDTTLGNQRDGDGRGGAVPLLHLPARGRHGEARVRVRGEAAVKVLKGHAHGRDVDGDRFWRGGTRHELKVLVGLRHRHL